MTRCLILLLFAAANAFGGDAPTSVTRAETLKIARRYLLHEWTGNDRNAFHGRDADGVRVDTADIAFSPKGGRPGWWRTDRKNVGMPYSWGGFDTPESFDAGLRAGKLAGDIYTLEKRRRLDAAVSKHTVGIDCSGLISRCWKLPRSYSTRELAALCEPLADFSQMKPGDIFNLHNAHVLLFAGWEDAGKTRLSAYEAGSPPTWKVLLNTMSLKFLTDKGYTAWRYHGMKE